MTATIQADTMKADTTAVPRTVTHGSFVLERTYDLPQHAVFDAWADRDKKNAWFGEGDDFVTKVDTYELDFRVGGRERLVGPLPSGRMFEYVSTYGEIQQDRRIVAMYDVLIDGKRISVSLLTVEFEPIPTGTHLIMTEQGAFFDGIDTNEERIKGAEDSLVNLDKYLATHG